LRTVPRVDDGVDDQAVAERAVPTDQNVATRDCLTGSADRLVTMVAAPLPEPALPARSRIPATTGAAIGVLIVVTNGERPLRRTCLPETLVCPKLAPCLA
jgi:hypothetical protein